MNILNNITTNTIIIIFLSLIVIIATYTGYIKPMIKNLINGKSINDTMTEAFTSQYSSLSPSLSNTVEFDTNSYLRDKNKPIIVKNTIALLFIAVFF